MPSRGSARPLAADGQPPPSCPHGGRTPDARAPWNVDVLPTRSRARRRTARGARPAGSEGARQTVGMTLARRLVAEAVGTALLLAAVVGSGIMGDRPSGGSSGLALLANSLVTGAALVALI